MDGDQARVIVAFIIGATITLSVSVMAVAQAFSSRRRKGSSDEEVERLERRLERMEQAIDAMAVQVERVAEGQQFTSRVLAGRQVERQP